MIAQILAAATETDSTKVAIIAAAAALLGGVLGAVAGGISDFFLERRREKVEVRVGARLVRSELASLAEMCAIAASDGRWRLTWDTSVPRWGEYGPILAAHLSGDDWTMVDTPVRALRALSAGIAKLDAHGNPTTLTPELGPAAVQGMTQLREQLRLAYNALSTLSRGPEADSTFGTRNPTSLP
jgi:hypothetical protein